jgi:hypothetical protein
MATEHISDFDELLTLSPTDNLVVNQDNGGGNYTTMRMQAVNALVSKLDTSIYKSTSGIWQDTTTGPTAAIPLTGALGKLTWFKLYRHALGGNGDTLATNAKLYGVALQYHETDSYSTAW